MPRLAVEAGQRDAEAIRLARAVRGGTDVAEALDHDTGSADQRTDGHDAAVGLETRVEEQTQSRQQTEVQARVFADSRLASRLYSRVTL